MECVFWDNLGVFGERWQMWDEEIQVFFLN
jgi:hypothetical protein